MTRLTVAEQADIIQSYVQKAIDAGVNDTAVPELTAKGITAHIIMDLGLVPVQRVEIDVCRDCVDAVEFNDNEMGLPDGTLARHVARMVEYSRIDFSQRVFGTTPEEYTEFSTVTCQGCGSVMAGARYEYSVVVRPHD